ncbi:protein FAR1-RELATED SEQUENCE 7-like [Mercurialis annua]|uniref:protein FAR1-RELATED SEQUENCE 7-like n=1 Tax=Mercurialis annua TaxID=3986 RepID=UPI002160B51A|nr:protein FAR1-RELATED SEQUENCE 7-like [Mercurialis annua]
MESRMNRNCSRIRHFRVDFTYRPDLTCRTGQGGKFGDPAGPTSRTCPVEPAGGPVNLLPGQKFSRTCSLTCPVDPVSRSCIFSYQLRHKWSTAFNNDTFHCGIKSTSRSEGTNHVLNGLGDKTTSLFKFVEGFEKMTKRWRDQEGDEDFNCTNGVPSCAIKESLILKQASIVYTNKIYKLFFEKEYLKGTGATNYEETACEGNLYEYKMWTHGAKENMVSTIFFNLDTLEVNCSCKKFESMGILCSHALKAFVTKNITKIPEKYVIPRWTRNAKERKHLLEIEKSVHEISESEIIYSKRAMRSAYDLVSRSRENEKARAIIYQLFEEGHTRLDDYFKNENADIQFSCRKNLAKKTLLDSKDDYEQILMDPPRVRTKGDKGERIKNHWEKRKKKPTCSNITSNSMVFSVVFVQ